MADCCMDHLVITAPTLEAGARYVKETLGLEMQPGGKHPRMGTHNLLLCLGKTIYLEVISSDPTAKQPDCPRWFGLDSLSKSSAPRLSAWVVRTTDIHAAAAVSSEPLGDVVLMSRGQLSWLISIPVDGLVPLDGVAPALIEWPEDIHPTSSLTDHGLSLVELKIFHPDPARVSRLLSSIGFVDQRTVITSSGVAAPYLIASIDTPRGRRELSFPGLSFRTT